MLFGMGTVIVFLTLLVFATTGMSALIQRYFPEPEPAAATTTAARTDDPILLAVITAAIKQHRSRRDQ